MDALAYFCFGSLLSTALASVSQAIYVAGMGWRGSDSFYEPASMVFGMALLNVIMGGFYPLLILSLWQAFTVAGSPYPLLFAVLVWHAISNMLLSHSYLLEPDLEKCWPGRATNPTNRGQMKMKDYKVILR